MKKVMYSRGLVAFMSVTFALSALADITWWSVPAMSGVQRLPEVIPSDGEKGGPVKIVAARGEYEPGSFVVRSDTDLGKVAFSIGNLVNEKGDVFPADDLDLRVVKVWYQNKNGWFSYFADTGFKLCPELLLHDEDLIRVDREKVANYARMTNAKGETREWWLNPPRKLNGCYFHHYVETTAFPSMSPDFVDAKTLQPVSLGKDESKQFILTVHVRPNTPAGLYRGEIKLSNPTAPTIPVSLRVLDFDLPRPMSYLHPDKDFRVCSYDYIGSGRILELNGGDKDLMWKQLEAILANFVAHGQDMKWLRSDTASAESERTLAIMKKVGMRTDVIVGGVDFKWQEKDEKAAFERASRIANYYERKYGHHDVYGSYGDEPGVKFFSRSRPIFDGYQSAGLKFIIASHEYIFDLAGYRWDWHNASQKPTNTNVPMLWNQLGGENCSAWYADQHVGAENPEFNRRQNGLGAYLSGYNALCNYAHHLGPYNDDSETYKPMVFAYGTGDGVIDTLQWEGFREGVDDIRYATKMLALARAADKSEDLSVRHLAGKAKVFLARFDRKTGDLNLARGEMIRYIEELRKALGNEANVEIAVKRTPPAARRPFADEAAPSNPKALPAYYAKRYMIDEQVAALKQSGQKLAAAKVLTGRSSEQTEEARRLAEEALKESVTTKNKQAFESAWTFLLDENPSTADKYFADAVGILGPSVASLQLQKHATGLTVAYNGNWQRVRRDLELAREAEPGNVDSWTCKAAIYAIPAYLEIGDVKSVKEFCDFGLATALRNVKNPEFQYKSEDVYLLHLAKEICEVKDSAAVLPRLSECDAKYGKDLEAKKRKDMLERLGSFAMCANNEKLVRGVSAFLGTVFAEKPNKAYEVPFSPKRILGLGSWDAAAAVAKPGTEKLDRAYGGDASCLWTDVATARGTVDADANKSYARLPEWQAMADEWGIHFRLEVFDEKAEEIGLGLASAGSLEGYLAPGENTPYHALLHSFEPGGLLVYNGVYSEPDHREIDAKDRVNCREEVATTKESVILYMAFSWNVYATRVPTDKSVWDFEPMFWGRKASCSWNGLKTIHGRSSWGHLKFALTESDRRRILRPLLANARKSYESAKRPDSLIGKWQNEEVGDPAFYEAVLKPLVTKYDDWSSRIAANMDDATIDELSRSALPAWHNLQFEVQRLRADYLCNQAGAGRLTRPVVRGVVTSATRRTRKRDEAFPSPK